MKQVIGAAAALALACAGTAFAKGAEETPAAAGGPARLTVAIVEDLRIENYETNLQTQLIEKGANVDLSFVLYPSTDYVTKINIMVQAGGRDLQDIIIANPAPSDSMLYQWAQAGAVRSLKKYYDDPQASANFRKAQASTGKDLLAQITSPDGEIYGMPFFLDQTSNTLPARLWYYEPWMTKLGLKEATTPEEFREVLRAIVKGDPNGNGKADEIGMAGFFRSLPAGNALHSWFTYLMNPYQYVGGSLINVDKGRLSVPYTTDGWREGLKYIRSLFAEGLIPTETLTQDDASVRAILASDPVRAFSFAFTSDSPLPTDKRALIEYWIAPPLKGPGGSYTTIAPNVPGIQFIVTTNCKNPDAAFRVGDYMTREEVVLTNRFGKQGLNWDYVEDVKNKDLLLNVAPVGNSPLRWVEYNVIPAFWGGTAVANYGWRQRGSFVLNAAGFDGHGYLPTEPMYEMTDLQKRNAARNDRANALYNAKAGPPEVLGKLIYTDDENALIADLWAAVEPYVYEMTSAFLAGNRDIDASWNGYLAELDKIGLPRLIAARQQAYDRANKK